MMLKNITIINMMCSILQQFLTVLCGFVIPRIILSCFGSEVNGLVSSLIQFLNYITLLEGGVTGVITASLYKPILNEDYCKISSILKTADKFYRKLAFIFLGYSLFISFFYPILNKTSFSFLYVFSLSIILSITFLIKYGLSLTYKTLLQADRKVYIISLSQSLIIGLTILLVYISVVIYPSIHIVKFISGILFLIQPFLYRYYIKKHYVLDADAELNNDLLKQRWNGFAINIAAFVHFSVPVVVLTSFCDLLTVSVYSVYNLVIVGIRSLVNAIVDAVNPSIGRIYAQNDIIGLNKSFNLYEFLMFFFLTIVFVPMSILIVPFVCIYTKNINDVNYAVPVFAYILVASEFIYLIKSPHVGLAYAANKFKEMNKPACIEVVIGLLVSIIFIKLDGLISVALGTFLSMLYRTYFQVSFVEKIVRRDSKKLFFKKVLVFLCSSAASLIIATLYTTPVEINLISWVIHAIYYVLISTFFNILFSFIFYRDELKLVFSYFNNKIK